MKAYRKQRIATTISYLAQKHTADRHKPTFQTDIYKLLAHFEFEILKETGELPLGFTYRARQMGPVPVELYEKNEWPDSVAIQLKGQEKTVVSVKAPDLDYLSPKEIEILDKWLFIFADPRYGTAHKNESSHEKIKSWKIARERRGLDSLVDPSDEFDHNPLENPVTIAEEHYRVAHAIGSARS